LENDVFNGKRTRFGCEVASFYVDQFPDGETARAVERTPLTTEILAAAMDSRFEGAGGSKPTGLKSRTPQWSFAAAGKWGRPGSSPRGKRRRREKFIDTFFPTPSGANH
jgi:hypothetical protein